VPRRALVATLGCLFFAVALAGSATAQTPAPPPPGPSLQIASAGLTQSGPALISRMRFSRDVPVAQFDASRSRFVCLVIGATVRTRRVCVSRRNGRLRATIAPTGPDGFVEGAAVVLRSARVAIDAEVLVLRIPASSLRVRLGRMVVWQAFVTWRDGGLCDVAAGPQPCTQVVPATGLAELRTRAAAAPAPRPGPTSGRLRLLATGDSMIQVIDGLLAGRLRGRRATSVRSDARISTGISKPDMLDWVRKAAAQARTVHPDVTVVFLGANDGFPMKRPSGARVACCGAGWVAEYARRVEAMMRSYERGGRSLVYWMTLPAPRPGNFAHVFRAVNRAIRRARVRVGGGARLIDLVPVFTPGGRFRQRVTFRGQTVSARQPDGIHLSLAGASIATTLLIERLRADRALPRLR